jgi:DNA polymerase-3 subunit epsilon
MLDNITRDFADESERDRHAAPAHRGSRASLGNLQAAVELLDDPDLDAATRERFQGVVRDEVAAMSRRIQDLAAHHAGLKTRWPLEDMLGADLVARRGAAHRGQQCGCRVGAEVDAALWLKVDSYSLLQALAYLAGRLVDEYEVKLLQLRLQRRPKAARTARPGLERPGMSTEIVMGWETDAITVGGETSALTGARRGRAPRRRVLVRARARAPPGVLPLPAAAGGPGAQLEARRPVDAWREPPRVLRLRPLRARADARWPTARWPSWPTPCSTPRPPGLDPGRRRDHPDRRHAHRRRQAAPAESFEQLVDPQRDIPAAGIPIHGITPEMVAGQPTIDQVLPAFHALRRTPCWWRTTRPSTCASCSSRSRHRREVRAAGARHAAAVGRDPPAAGIHRLEAIAERWASPSWAATPRWATPWSPPRCS